jgi:hypothetical protein
LPLDRFLVLGRTRTGTIEGKNWTLVQMGFAMIDYIPGLKISGPTSQYEKDVQDLLDKYISRNPVGAIILYGISDLRLRWRTTIVPYTAEDAPSHGGNCQAFANPLDEDGAHPKDHRYPAGHADSPTTRDRDEREDLSDTFGTGTGTKVEVHFSPWMWREGGACSMLKYYGAQPDEVLVHELFHALRMMKGIHYASPLYGNLRGYDDAEEFYAIVVTNVYISVKCGCTVGLRADRLRSNAELHYPLNTSAGFLKDLDNLEWVFYLSMSDRELFLALAAVVGARFNPFREYVNDIDYWLEQLF